MLAFLTQIVQLKVSVIGTGKQAEHIFGKWRADTKIAEISVALLTVGIRVTLRV